MYANIVAFTWITFSLVAGVLARQQNRPFVRWFLIAMVFSPLSASLALTILSLFGSSRLNNEADENPFAAGSTSYGVFSNMQNVATSRSKRKATAPVEQQRSRQESPVRAPMRQAFVAVTAIVLLAPAIWMTTTLQASTSVAPTNAATMLPPEIAALPWEAPSCVPLSRPSSAVISSVDKAAETAPSTAPLVEAGSVTHVANIRSGPGLEYEITDLAETGSIIPLTGQSQDSEWYQLPSGDWIASFLVTRIGAVPAESLDAEYFQAQSTSAHESAIDGPRVNVVEAYLRSGPGTEFGVVDTVQAGHSLQLIGVVETGDWYRLEDGRWIFAELVSEAPSNLEVVELASDL